MYQCRCMANSILQVLPGPSQALLNSSSFLVATPHIVCHIRLAQALPTEQVVFGRMLSPLIVGDEGCGVLVHCLCMYTYILIQKKRIYHIVSGSK